jgi:hypothetical protein
MQAVHVKFIGLLRQGLAIVESVKLQIRLRQLYVTYSVNVVFAPPM